MSDTAHTPPTPCLGCGKVVDAATSITKANKPSPGDITICFYCGHIMAFAEDLTVRELTDDEIHEVAGNPMILRVQSALAEFKKQHPK